MHNKRRVISPTITPEAEEGLVRFPPILKQILFNRGLANYEDARAFLRAVPSFDTDPFQLTGMEATVDRILHAVRHSEPIAVYGDYDVDGVTATALLVDELSSAGANVRHYIPNRFDEGYALNIDADHMGRDAQRDALRAGVRRAGRVSRSVPGHAATSAGCPTMVASAARLVMPSGQNANSNSPVEPS